MVEAGSGRRAVRVFASFTLLLVAGCSCDDRLIDLPSKDRFGDPIQDRVLPVGIAPPEVSPGDPPDGPDGDGIVPGFQVKATGGADCAGGAVQLRTQVIGGTPPLVYSWSPADGLSDPTAANPVSTDGVPHQYRVTVTDATGATATTTALVDRRDLPTAELRFAAGASLSCEGDEVILDGSGSLASDGGPVTLSWDLDGDPDTTEANGTVARFVPAEAVAVHLTVTDALGCTTVLEQPITVRALPLPAIAFTQGDERVCFGEAVALDGSASVDMDGQPVAAYAWDLDGDAGTVEESGAQVPPFAPTGAPVQLTVTDSYGCSASAWQPVVVGALPQPRIQFARGASLVCAGEEVLVDGSGSTDFTGGPVAGFAWDLDGDPITVESNAAAPPAFAPAGNGIARLLVTDAWGCSAEAAVPLAARPLPTASIDFTAGRFDACAGDGVALSAAGSRDADGNPVSAYAWDLNGDGAPDGSASGTGTFVPVDGQQARVIVTDSFGCSSSAVQPLDPRALPTVSLVFAEGADFTCSGAQVALDGSASRDEDGNPVAAYAWDLDGNAATVEGTAASTGRFAPISGSVTLTVRDARGCSASRSQSLAVGGLPTPRIAFTAGAGLVCSGETVALDGSGSTDASGGPVASYSWDLDGNGSFGDSAAAAPPGFAPSGSRSVRLRVTDARGCTAETSQIVASRALPSAVIAFDQGRSNVCAGGTVALRGSASRDADGNAVASYAWDLNGDGSIDGNGATSGSFVPAAAATARLTVTDSFGCSSSAVQPLAPRPLPTPQLAFTEGGPFSCTGGQVAIDGSGSRDADGNPVSVFAWDLDGNPATTERTTASTGPFAPAAGTVSLSVTDALGCVASATQPLAVGQLPTARIAFSAGSGLVCAGQSVALDGSGSTDASGGPVASYTWDLDGNGSFGDSAAAAPPGFAPAGTRTVRLRVTDANGCMAETSQPVTGRALPTAVIAFDQGRSNVCAGGSIALRGSGSRDADGAAVASYAWDLNGDGSIDGTGATSGSFVPAGAGTARLTVTDSFGCSASAVQPLAPRPLPTPRLTFTEGGSFSCSGAQVAIDGSGSRDADGNPVSLFAWDLDGNPSTTERTTASTGRFAPTTGTVSLQVTDALGCVASAAQSLTVGQLPTARIAFSAGAGLVCAGQSVALDGSLSRDAAGGPVASYSWDLDGNGTFGDSAAATPPGFAPAGTRTVRLRVTDANGCLAEASQPVTGRALPTAVIAFDQGRSNVCSGGSVVLRGSDSRDADGNAVASYAWDLNGDGSIDGTGATSGSFVPPAAATARLTVTDSLGCSSSAAQPLAPRAPPTASIGFLQGSARVCLGTTVQLDGSGSRDADGNAVAAWNWDLDGNGTTDSSAATPAAFTASSGRTATLQVTDALGCTASASQPVAVRGLPTARIAFTQGSQASCDGTTFGFSGANSTDVDGAPVASWSWDLDGNGTTDASGASSGPFVPHASGSAILTVADAEGCSATASQPYTVRPLPVVEAGPDVGYCVGGSARIGSAPAAGLSYSWSPGTGLSSGTNSNPLATPAATTTYTLTARDTFGCTNSDSVQVTVNPLPVANAGPDRQVGIGGTVTLLGSASGGTPGYNYAWTPASSLDDATRAQPHASPAGNQTYALTVTDVNGCTGSDSAFVEVRSAVTVHVEGENRLCLDGGASLTLTASTSGGVEPLSFRWTASPACSNCISNPTAPVVQVSPRQNTTFTVVVTDADGVTSTDSIAVQVLPSLPVNAGPDQHVARGGVVQIGSPGIAGLRYEWSCDNWSCGISDPSVPNPWVAPAGNTAYKVTVSGGSTCSASDVVVVTMDLRVLATVPEEGYNPWPRDALIWVAFDSDVDPATLAGNAEIWDPRNGTQIPFTSRYDSAARTLEIDPVDSAYWNNRPYVLRLKGGTNGIATPGPSRSTMVTDFILEYNASSNGDGRAPNVQWARPASFATGVLPTADLVVQFDEPVDPQSVTPTAFRINGVTGTVTYDPRTWVATFRPTSPMAPNQTYTVTIDGVRDGARNRALLSWTFTTGAASDTTPPQVLSSDPANNSLSVDVASPFLVTFSEPIDTTTLGGLRLIDLATGYPVSAEVVYDELTRTATLDTGRVLEPQHRYRIDVSAVKDYAGNSMNGVYSATFTTVQVLLLERFENGSTGWTLASPWGLHFQGARAGSMGLVDSPSGNTPLNLNAAATTPWIATGGRASALLSLWNQRMMPSDADQVLVEYSTNGTTWTSAGNALQEPAGWRLATWSIPTGGAPQFKVRLRMSTNSSLQGDGIFLDEFVIR